MNIDIRDSLSDLASYDEEEDRDNDVDEDTELGKLSKDDDPGWVMGTISKTVMLCTEIFRQTLMKLD